MSECCEQRTCAERTPRPRAASVRPGSMVRIEAAILGSWNPEKQVWGSLGAWVLIYRQRHHFRVLRKEIAFIGVWF